MTRLTDIETPRTGAATPETAEIGGHAFPPAAMRNISPEELAALVAQGRRMQAEFVRDLMLAFGRRVSAPFRGRASSTTINEAGASKANASEAAQAGLLSEAASPLSLPEAASSTLSHDLRTPLTAIRSCSELLIDHPDMPGDHRERFLGSIHEEALRLESKIDSILRLAETEPGGLAERLAAALRGPSAPAGAH